LGENIVECHAVNYMDYMDTIDVVYPDQLYNIPVSGFLAETLQVTEDATVKYLDDWDLGWYHDTLRLTDDNYGQEPYLSVGCVYMDDFIAAEPEDYWSDYRYIWRMFFNLPTAPTNNPTLQLDSVKLSMKMFNRSGISCCMVFRRVLEPWFEDSITWNNMPILSDIQDSLPFPEFSPTWICIDLTENYSGYLGEHFGLAFSYSHEWTVFPYMYDGGCSIHSSEATDPADRPIVIFYYSN
jgi:hypothetical protein